MKRIHHFMIWKKILLIILVMSFLLMTPLSASMSTLNFTNITPQIVGGSTPQMFCIFETNTSDYYVLTGSLGFNNTLVIINRANISTPTTNVSTYGYLITNISP